MKLVSNIIKAEELRGNKTPAAVIDAVKTLEVMYQTLYKAHTAPANKGAHNANHHTK